MKRQTVFIIDDDFFSRDALAMYLSKSERTVVLGSCSFDGELCDSITKQLASLDAVAVVCPRDPEQLQEIAASLSWLDPSPSLVVLAVKMTDELTGAALRAGSTCLLEKQDVGVEISEILPLCGSGKLVVTPGVVARLFNHTEFVPEGGPTVVNPSNRLAGMSPKIASALRMFCLWGMGKNQIAEELGVSPNTVASRLKAGYAELGVSSRSEAVEVLLHHATGSE